MLIHKMRRITACGLGCRRRRAWKRARSGYYHPPNKYKTSTYEDCESGTWSWHATIKRRTISIRTNSATYLNSILSRYVRDYCYLIFVKSSPCRLGHAQSIILDAQLAVFLPPTCASILGAVIEERIVMR